MTIRIYNTISRKKEDFEPIEPGRVRMYVCGPTVYDYCHIGHARSIVVFDVIAAYLRVKGYDVNYIRNFTDIDDKIIKRANELGMDTVALADRFIREFYKDMDALNIERATKEPKATGHIDEIISLIETLIEKEYAYEVDGDVYFSVERFENYGRLSGRRLEDMEAGARLEIDKRKRNPFDFALWKSAKKGEPFWKSPWGAGRPGWHIECSAMSTAYLGETIDIHGGGKDLIFPHHENELAQTEAATGKKFVKYWVHNGFVNIDNEKMAKSLGNFKMIRDVLKTVHPEAVRLFLLSSHYRSPIDFSDQALNEAMSGIDKMYALLSRTEKQIKPVGDKNKEEPSDTFWKQFCDAMDDDFNTARAVGVLFDTVRNTNRLLDEEEVSASEDNRREISAAFRTIHQMGAILGILQIPVTDYFAQKKEKGLSCSDMDEQRVEALIAERGQARRDKNWKRADEIRDELAQMKIVLEDRPDGTIWKFTE